MQLRYALVEIEGARGSALPSQSSD